MLAMSLLVVLQAFIDVIMPPPEHAIHQDGKLVGHGCHRFGCAEFAAKATILGAEVALASEERGRGEPERGGGPIDHAPRASAKDLPTGDAIIGTQAVMQMFGLADSSVV